LLLVWVSSTTVGSLGGREHGHFNSSNYGYSHCHALNAAKNQVVKTAEAVTDAMGTRLGSAVPCQGALSYLDMLRPPELDLSKFVVNLKDMNDPS